MMLARANLVAGERHPKYPRGVSYAALLFVNVSTEGELETVAARELSERGWATMEILRFKDVVDFTQFNGAESTEAQAFHEALSTGFSVIVFP